MSGSHLLIDNDCNKNKQGILQNVCCNWKTLENTYLQMGATCYNLFYSFILNAHEHDYIMCNAQLQGHKKRDIASIYCMCPN